MKVVVAIVARLLALNTPELVTVKFVSDVILFAVNTQLELVVSPEVLDEVSVLEAREWMSRYRVHIVQRE